MTNIHRCQIAKSDILGLRVLNNSSVAFATKTDGIKIFDYRDNSYVDSIEDVHLNSQVNACAFSPNNKMFAFVNNHNIYILDIPTKHIIHTIETDKERVEILSFDSSSKYIFAGTQDGRVLQYRYDSSSLLSRVCSFPHEHPNIKAKDDKKYVSAFAYHKNYLACSGYGGAIFVIDLHLQTNICITDLGGNRIDTLCFLDDDTIISGNSIGEIHVIPLSDAKNFKKISTPLSSIKQIVLMHNPEYIMVSGDDNYISVIDVKKCKIAHSKYIMLESDIDKMAIANDDHLIVSLKNRYVLDIELPSEAKLRSLTLMGLIEQAYELIENEPMLEGSYEHKLLDDKFDQAYLKATKALIDRDKESALKILALYQNIRSKQMTIKELFKAFGEYDNFQTLFKEQRYALVYAMASKFPSLEHTPEYKKTERIFKTAFSNAQKLVLRGKTEEAKIILGQYATVMSKRAIIKMILTQSREFVEFLKAIQDKDFKKIEELIKLNEIFTHIPTYTALYNEIEETLANIESLIQKGDTDTAQKELFKLENITHINDRVEKLYEECKNVQRLYAAYNNDDFKFCYKLLDSHKSLNFTELGLLLEGHWSKIMNRCEEFALSGNIKDIKKTLGDLIDLPTRLNRVGDLIRVSFHVRVEQLMSKRNFHSAEAIIYSYVDIFGLDSEIVQIMKKFERASSHKLAITQTQKNRPTRDSWVHSEIVTKSRHQ